MLSARRWPPWWPAMDCSDLAKEKTMWKLGIVLMVIGGCLAYFGYLEYQVGSQSSAKPVDVELADLEAGKPLPDNHTKIGRHHRIYGSSVYEYETDDGSQPRPSSPVNWTYYPILSDKHPSIMKMRELEKKYGSWKKVPEAERPRVKDFAVIVKTEDFKTIKDIPGGRKYNKSISGLVINEIESLGDDEKDLIRAEFPKIEFEKVFILEEYRKPTSVPLSIGLMIGGGVLIVLPLLLILRSRLRGGLPAKPPADGDTQAETPSSDPTFGGQ